ncbi:MAG: hypothetical protein WD872_15640 [Pirellulaceae bacterium]
MRLTLPTLLAEGSTIGDRSLAIVLAAGLASLFLALAVLVWTRWGQARPIAKCAGLSFAAHALLLIYAYSTRVLFDQPGSWLGQTVKVRLADPRDDQEAAPQLERETPQPWERPGEGDIADLNVASPTRTVIESAEPERAEVPLPDVEISPPAPSPLPLASAAPAIPAPSEPALAQPAVAPAPAAAIHPAEMAANEPPTAAEPSVEPTAGVPSDLADMLPELPRKIDAPAAASVAQEPARQPPAVSEATSPAAGALAADTGESYASAPAAIPRRLGDGQEMPEPLRARVAADRLQVATPFGATPETEAAVAAALEWLAANQSADGRWDADAHGAGRETRTLGHDRQGAGAQADTGITGLALLAFLGSGQTHLDGRHREHVQHGLEFLLASQARDGNLAGQAELFASMYCHGISLLALSEAYALTGDERLRPGLEKGLRYTIAAQHAGGGWRYQPYDAGDMSQFGWQLMALRSAELAGIPIPAETRTRMARFLRSASSGRAGGLASYRPGDRVSRSMTAEALVCRFFLQTENQAAALTEASTYVLEERPGEAATNFYYWYYGTLALFQRQGDDWEAWNTALQRQLLPTQRFDGERRGSWDPDPLWGGYGGRVYSTAIAALSLEVYYRYLPMHGGASPLERLTDRPSPAPYSR